MSEFGKRDRSPDVRPLADYAPERAAGAYIARTHVADSHNAIRVQGARENNLKDVNVEIPKRRLTVFTGVSGSGKSSLVFNTIAAESQRMINETYSAFVQGFMPSLGRPDVDVLEGLTTAIIVDQERMGANIRSTVGTATDANALLRILFSRLGQPYVGPANAFSFNIPTTRGGGAMKVERGPGEARVESRRFISLGGMCPRCEGTGRVTDINLAELYDDSKSLNEGPFHIPNYSPGGWYVRIFAASGFLDPDKPIRQYTEQEMHDFLYREPVKVNVAGTNITYEGLIPKLQKSFLSKDPATLRPHMRAFVERAVTFVECPDCGRHTAQRRGPFVENYRHEHRGRMCDANERFGRMGAGTRRTVGSALTGKLAPRARFVRRHRARLFVFGSTRGDVVGRGGPADENDSPSRLRPHRCDVRV